MNEPKGVLDLKHGEYRIFELKDKSYVLGGDVIFMDPIFVRIGNCSRYDQSIETLIEDPARISDGTPWPSIDVAQERIAYSVVVKDIGRKK